jgi:hypothetical protein
MEDKIDEIINRIVKNINDYKNNYIKPKLGSKLKDEKFFVLNNSYFSRGKSKDIPTYKSDKYLGFYMKDNITGDDCFVVEIMNPLSRDFKEYDNKPENTKQLKEEVEEEIKNLGEIVFLLVSEYSEGSSLSKKIENKYFKKITFNPLVTKALEICDDEIIINQLDNCNEEKLLNGIKTKIESENKGKEFSKDLEKKIIKAINEIKKESCYFINISDKTKKGSKCILDEILSSIRKNSEDYNNSINKDFNNVLRIAYIFSYDVINLIKFLISVGDLKPLINWETFLTKYKFYESMMQLPGVLKQNKVEIKKYIDIISKSRNKKFHRIFPFERKFKVKLSNNAIKEPVIIFFERYNNNKEHDILEYKDKQLIKLLQKFNITEEETVQKDFWEKNSEVIENSIIYISEFCDVLKELRGVYFSN